jgi:hypothetical protein
MNRMDAIALAIKDANADVHTCLREYGLVPLFMSLEPDAVTWEESARGAEQAALNRLPPELHETYYETYGRVATACVQALRDQSERPQGDLP